MAKPRCTFQLQTEKLWLAPRSRVLDGVAGAGGALATKMASAAAALQSTPTPVHRLRRNAGVS